MSDFNKNAQDIKNKASSLYDTAKENASKAYYKTKPEADELVSKMGDTASDLYESGKEKFHQTEDYIEDSLTSLTTSIRKQPLTSMLIAAGVGYLYGKFFK